MGMSGPLTDEQKRQLSMVKNSSELLLSLINDILDISKIEAGRVELHQEEFRLDGVIKEVVEPLLPAVNKKGVTLTTEVPEGVTLFSDKRRFKQILLNLLSNAVKFTERGSVRVSAGVPSDNQLTIRVIDTGIGIKKEETGRLFQPFQQVGISLAKKYEGTGLGLYLTDKLATLLGGKISVQSEYGQGSEFTYTMPLRRTEEKQQ